MIEVALTDLCRPKQWPTIPMSQLSDEGYAVFGANGRIGFFNQYNHKEPTLMITCRGATCGTVNVSEPYSYITGNAMALDNFRYDKANFRYLYHYLCKRGFADIISGSAQPQITRIGFDKVKVPLPPLPEQKRIAAILDKADAMRQKRKQSLKLLDEFIRSVFLDMFGDPLVNSKGWNRVQLSHLGTVVTGNTPSRMVSKYYNGNEIEWIKSDNINTPSIYLTKAREYLSKEGKTVARVAPRNSILVTCIAGSPDCIGNVSIADRQVAFNQQINALIPSEEVDIMFLFAQFIVAKKLVQRASTNSMKGMVSKTNFERICFLNPPKELQQNFGHVFSKAITLKTKLEQSAEELNNQFKSLVQRAFRGEL